MTITCVNKNVIGGWVINRAYLAQQGNISVIDANRERALELCLMALHDKQVSADYPLGGMIEPYDIEREKKYG